MPYCVKPVRTEPDPPFKGKPRGCWEWFEEGAGVGLFLKSVGAASRARSPCYHFKRTNSPVFIALADRIPLTFSIPRPGCSVEPI